jgi:hypothetical protein
VIRRALASAVLAGLGLTSSVAWAQAGASPRPRSFEVFVGAFGLGGVDFGSSAALLTANQPSSPDFVLFKSATSVGVGFGLDARLAFNLTRTFAVEAGLVWSRSTVSSRITSDAEDVPAVTLTQSLDTYFVDVSGVVHLNALTFAGGRGLPFVAAGAGYLRQLDDNALLVDTGQVYHAGGGVKFLLRQRRRGFIRGVGLRADARVYVRTAGLELVKDTTRRATWAASAGLLVRF